MRVFLVGLLVLGAVSAAEAVPLSIVHIPSNPCGVFGPDCRIFIFQDIQVDITLDGTTAVGPYHFLQSRVGRGRDDLGPGLWVYPYQINLLDLERDDPSAPCIDSFSIPFGPVVSTLDYDGLPGAEHIFVTGSSLGNIGLSAADQVGKTITFTFERPICPTTLRPGDGTHFFYLASTRSPRSVTARLEDDRGGVYPIEAYAPEVCTGDCNGDGGVTVDELLTMVNIALGQGVVFRCLGGDATSDGNITVDEILMAVRDALESDCR